MNLSVLPIRIKRPQRSSLHAVAHLSASGVRMLIYGPLHDPLHAPPENWPVAGRAPLAEGYAPLAEGSAPLAMAEGSPPDPAHLAAALRSASAALPGPLDALTLVIPAAQCRIAHRAFPVGVAEAEAHALAAQMATQIAAELGHSAPIAFDWQRISTDEIALCLAPRALIAAYLEAVQAAGLRCVAITPENDSTPTDPASAPFNLIPWRNTTWLKQGQRRSLWLAATSLLAILPALWIATQQIAHEQALTAQQARLQETLKTRQAQLPNLAQLRQQLATQQAAQQAEQAAREAARHQQQAWAARLDQLARRRPQEVRYHSLSYDSQGLRLEGLAQTPAALTHLLKALSCPHLSEGQRDADGLLRFALQLPATCSPRPSTTP